MQTVLSSEKSSLFTNVNSVLHQMSVVVQFSALQPESQDKCCYIVIACLHIMRNADKAKVTFFMDSKHEFC